MHDRKLFFTKIVLPLHPNLLTDSNGSVLSRDIKQGIQSHLILAICNRIYIKQGIQTRYFKSKYSISATL